MDKCNPPIAEYDIIVGMTPKYVIDTVQKKINQGWQPIGHAQYSDGNVVQTIVKYEDPLKQLEKFGIGVNNDKLVANEAGTSPVWTCVDTNPPGTQTCSECGGWGDVAGGKRRCDQCNGKGYLKLPC